MYVSAFVSQGYLKTTEYDYLIENSTNGTAELNEVALSMLMDPADRFRLGIQLFSRDLGAIGNNDVRISWAFGDYRWKDWLGVRGGKIKMQMGLYNIGREVDMLRTPIFLPSSVYSQNWQDFTLAHEGFSLYGSTTSSGWGALDYEVFGGALNIPDPNQSFWKKAFSSNTAFNIEVTNRLDAWEVPNTSLQFVRTADIEPTFPWVMGGGVVWNTPVDGLRLGGSFNSGEYEMTFNTISYQNTLDPVTGEIESRELIDFIQRWQDRYYMAVGSIEYTWEDFVIAAEHMTFAQSEVPTSVGQYLMVTWDRYSSFSLSAYGSNYLIDVDDPAGKDRVALGYEDYTSWQREAVLSARFNITPNWLVKAEFHAVDGVANVLYLDAIESSSRYWTMTAFKTTFHF